jgi:hypothetical protein
MCWGAGKGGAPRGHRRSGGRSVERRSESGMEAEPAEEGGNSGRARKRVRVAKSINKAEGPATGVGGAALAGQRGW